MHVRVWQAASLQLPTVRRVSNLGSGDYLVLAFNANDILNNHLNQHLSNHLSEDRNNHLNQHLHLTMRYSLALCLAILSIGSLNARRMLQDNPSGDNTTLPLIFLRPAYYRTNANELPLTYNDRKSNAVSELTVWTPNNTLTLDMPFLPLGSLVRVLQSLRHRHCVCRLLATTRAPRRTSTGKLRGWPPQARLIPCPNPATTL